MIAASLVAWLWMAAQAWNVAGAPHCHEYPDPDGCNTCTACDDNPGLARCTLLGCTRVGGVDTPPKFDPNSKEFWTTDPPPATAEHVIEIRTRHHLPKGSKYCYVDTDGPNSANDGKTPPCPPDTHEIYVDGVKWGVLKESQ